MLFCQPPCTAAPLWLPASAGPVLLLPHLHCMGSTPSLQHDTHFNPHGLLTQPICFADDALSTDSVLLQSLVDANGNANKLFSTAVCLS